MAERKLPACRRHSLAYYYSRCSAVPLLHLHIYTWFMNAVLRRMRCCAGRLARTCRNFFNYGSSGLIRIRLKINERQIFCLESLEEIRKSILPLWSHFSDGKWAKSANEINNNNKPLFSIIYLQSG